MTASSSANAPPAPSLSMVLAASATAGGLEPLLTYPLEYIKTRQQLQSSIRSSHLRKAPLADHLSATTRSVLETISERDRGAQRRTGIVGVAQDAWKSDGYKSFYRGVGIVSAGGMAKSVVRMGVYDRLKRALQTADGGLSGGRSLIAGIGAGMAETLLVVVPTETVKTKIVQATTLPKEHDFHKASKSSLEAVRTLSSVGGARVMYAGLTATLCRQMSSAMIRFGTYQTLKNLVGGSMRPGQKLPSGITFGLGALSGMATVFSTMPFDVVKTRMQSIGARARYRNTWWCLVHTVQDEGLRTLWRGSTMRLCRLPLSGAITFTVYEEIISLAGYA